MLRVNCRVDRNRSRSLENFTFAFFIAGGFALLPSPCATAQSDNGFMVEQQPDAVNLEQTPALSFTDAQCNNNGAADPGETLIYTIPLSNNTVVPASSVVLSLNGGPMVSYGAIGTTATVIRQANFTVPPAQPCGSSITLTLAVNSSLGATNITRSLFVGRPFGGFFEDFDSVTAPVLPTGWTSVHAVSGNNWVTASNAADSMPNSAFINDSGTVTDVSLVSPMFTAVGGSLLTFRNNYSIEQGFDGGVLEISISSGPFQDIVTAGGVFSSGGYTQTINGTGNPLGSRPAWTGNSLGYISTVVSLPPAAAGQSVQLRWRIGTDPDGGATGWRVDSVSFTGGSAVCTPGICVLDLIFRNGFEGP